ncbi:hypothetical protein RHMOL_Rhmol11G0254000 [Rhododendron molle]|uniref:Uncharacterized protein n=1 Tax=Rhododendron molle TaxID=49168 RepID=A0ACC0LX20_RHOML|nr:hypothetical protein RHMOL_Rhmol11G0254000 [Rhododendron molle]
MEISHPVPAAPHNDRRFHSNNHTHAHNLRRFNIGEDCPVFDIIFPFCQVAVALPSRVLPPVTNDGGATITNDALMRRPACYQRQRWILSTALPGSRSSSLPAKILTLRPQYSSDTKYNNRTHVQMIICFVKEHNGIC